RLPRVLHASTSERAVDGLMYGLADRRFEVRYQSGRTLAVMRARNSALKVPERAVFETIRKEVDVSRDIWESHRLLDRAEDSDGEHFVDEFLKTRTSRSLEHVFTLLSLVLPSEPLRIAFHGLHTDDANLR